MQRSEIEIKDITKINNGASYSVILPKRFLNELNITQDDKICIKLDKTNKQLIIKKLELEL